MLNAQRGQTMPFWLVAITITLGMAVFIASYVNTITWQIHAQNAADSAAAAGVSVKANVLNEETTILYTAAVDEYRIRYLNQAMLNALNGIGCQNTPLTVDTAGKGCRAIYLALQPELNAAIDGYSDDVKLLQEANNFTQGGQQQAERKAIGSFGQFDSSFAYTPLCPDNNGNGNSPSCPTSSGNGKGHKAAPTAVDLVACKNVPYFAPGLMKLPAGSQFTALGRAAAEAVPVNTSATPPPGTNAPSGYSEYFQPGLQTNPATNQPYQLPEDPAATGNLAYFTVDYGSLNPGGGLTVDLNWFGSVAIKPFYTGGSGSGGGLGPGDYTCS